MNKTMSRFGWIFFLTVFLQAGVVPAQEAASPLGIFDATADWGLEPDFGPKRGNEKVPGRVVASSDISESTLDIFGNGDDIWDQQDEGFFVYTEASGSWSFTAKIRFADSGGGNEWAKVGLMVREKAALPQSRYYSIALRAGRHRFLGDAVHAQWREKESGMSANTPTPPHLLMPRNPIRDKTRGVYLRITRDAQQQMVSSEWSYDRSYWYFLHSMRFVMDSTAAFGVAIANHEDNSLLARAEISEVSLVLSQPTGKRFISSDRFLGTDVMDVILVLQNPQETPRESAIRERVPKDWEASGISHNGVESSGTISWDLPLQPGSTVLKYTVRVGSQSDKIGAFTGTMNGALVQGAQEVLVSPLDTTALAKSEFYQTAFFTTVPLIMMILHLSLFYFHPRARENLHFAVLLFCVAGAEYVWNKKVFVADPRYLHVLDFFFFAFALGILASMENMFMFLIYQGKPDSEKKDSPLWVMIKILIAVSILSVFLSFFNFSWNLRRTLLSNELFALILGGIFTLIWLRILALGFIRRLEGIGFISFGSLILLALFIWLDLSIFRIVPPIPDPKLVDGAFLLFIVNLSVYLAYKFAQSTQRLEVLTVELEHRVKERTRDLEKSNQELFEANKHLQELDQMKSSFVSQASHDLRTPLTAIKGSLENLLLGIAGEITEKQKKIVERATRSVDRLTGLVNDILDLSRIESGRMVVEKTVVPFIPLLETVLVEYRPAAEQKRIALHSSLPDGQCLALIDASKIQRVVGELVCNAVKYTPEGGSVHVALTQSSNRISLSVVDSGIGMTPEECQKIWERFYRTAASQNMAKGTGLGLSIAKELVELHAGTLTVISVAGAGSTFTLTLPLYSPSAKTA